MDRDARGVAVGVPLEHFWILIELCTTTTPNACIPARQEIAASLQVDTDRIRYAPLDGKERGKLGTTGDHWQIHYRDEW